MHRIHGAAFGAPVEAAGRTVIPVSRVVGGGGGFRLWPFSGSGGWLRARPVGLYRIDAHGEEWLPARPSRLGLGLVLGAVLAGVATVTVVRRARSAPEQPVSRSAAEPG